ncbi:MAG: type II secretion system protein [Phycisphaerales bacterium JB059]|jgi:general secretion pathway protein G
MRANRKRNRAGAFTLVEILIVVVILGILAAIVVPQFTSAADEARGGNVATQETTLETQLELFAARNNGTYPDIVGTDADGSNWDPLVTADYVKSPPRNPFSAAANATHVTAFDFTDVASANAEASAEDADDGWLYDATDGIIRAAGRPNN